MSEPDDFDAIAAMEIDEELTEMMGGPSDEDETRVDLGGGMVVPLSELLDGDA